MQDINCREESKRIENWMQKVFSESGMEKIIIGLSGGIDSAVSCALSTCALGKEKIIPVLLPYGALSSEGVTDAELVIDFLKIPREQVRIIDIKKGVDALISQIDFSTSPSVPLTTGTRIGVRSLKGEGSNVRLGNIMARVRMIYLFDLAKQYSGLVCGTENKSEHYLGYFTRFGDEASDIEPIRHLYKTHVWEMGKFLELPEKVITKAPTAGLWDGQTDESELGFGYQEADRVLSYFVDEKLTEKEIVGKGLDTMVVSAVLKRMKKNEFKQYLPFVYP